MKKFLALCLAAVMVLASAAVVMADDVMLISEEPVVEAPVVAEEVVIDDVDTPDTAPIFRTWFWMPRVVNIKVDTTEGGSVNVPAKFMAAITSSRTIKVTPAEGYEVADIIVNGESYGPAYSIVLKNIQVGLNIEVKFAEIPVVEEVPAEEAAAEAAAE